MSRTRTLEFLTDKLGKPSKGFSQGDQYSSGGRIRQREHTYWSFHSHNSDASSFDNQLTGVMKFMDENSDALSVLKSDCEIDIFCMLSSDNGQGGAALSADLLKRLSKYSVDVVFDMYASDER